MKQYEASTTIGEQTLTLQFGKLAKLATTSVFAKLGETCVLVTVTEGGQRTDIDYFPLQVIYAEKLYAGGIIKGSRWVKREGRPSDEAILNGRLIDRSIRPLFPKNYRKEVQIVITLLSVDNVNPPEILASIATSAALHVSPIPWNGPISTLQVGYIPTETGENSFIINPTEQQEEFSELNLVASTSKEKVVMIETQAQELSNNLVAKALMYAKEQNRPIIDFIESIRAEIGAQKEVVNDPLHDEKLLQSLKKDFSKELDAIVAEKASKEGGSSELTSNLITEAKEKYGTEFETKAIAKAVEYLVKQLIRDKTLDTKVRVDGRDLDTIRELSAEVGVLPRTHGTGIFNRGTTQVLSIATLGAPKLEQLIETPEGQEVKSYIHHYYFPPYSVGETGRIGSVSRREIGHGALAEKALVPVLPDDDEFPYTIRVVSEVLTSNGSTSMASTCGSTLALMDAGVPIKAPVAGIAMGIMTRSDDDYVILTDIMGIEDFSGEMDFKVTGTRKGITAIQLDVKNNGLTDKMIAEILEKAQTARFTILDVMEKVIASPRESVSKYAPNIEVFKIEEDKIGTVIGPGGKTIRSIIAKTNTDITVNDDGEVTVSGLTQENVDQAVEIIKSMTRDVEVGEEFEGEVKRIMEFGAFVEILPGKEGLVHVSKMSNDFVKDPHDVVEIGQKVKVKVYEIDKMGRINLTMNGNTSPSRGGGGNRDRGGRGGRFQDRRGGRRDNRHGGDHRDNRRRERFE
ncbi:polyribonucleotide nucleotidyltransferase [Candidatus Woesebacteria bacterium]|nr:polyribonucleotide nucleotidyltransferase [Candidatus Woesebacteria bacterium]